MPVPIFPMAENLTYHMYGKWEEKHAHADVLVAYCGFQAQY